jgi:hypothetical protein
VTEGTLVQNGDPQVQGQLPGALGRAMRNPLHEQVAHQLVIVVAAKFKGFFKNSGDYVLKTAIVLHE